MTGFTSHSNIYVPIETFLEVQCDPYVKIRDIRDLKIRSDAVKKEIIVATLMARRDLGARIEFMNFFFHQLLKRDRLQIFPEFNNHEASSYFPWILMCSTIAADGYLKSR